MRSTVCLVLLSVLSVPPCHMSWMHSSPVSWLARSAARSSADWRQSSKRLSLPSPSMSRKA